MFRQVSMVVVAVGGLAVAAAAAAEPKADSRTKSLPKELTVDLGKSVSPDKTLAISPEACTIEGVWDGPRRPAGGPPGNPRAGLQVATTAPGEDAAGQNRKPHRCSMRLLQSAYHRFSPAARTAQAMRGFRNWPAWLALVLVLPLPVCCVAGAQGAPASEAKQHEGRALWVYVGTYASGANKGIYSLRMDLATGALTAPRLAAAITSPSFLCVHPSHRFLYAVSEIYHFAGKMPYLLEFRL